MPPGTGDIQITLTQSISLTGAVIVTTPHKLSLVDAAKGNHCVLQNSLTKLYCESGVAMFEDLKVPTLAVVENMAYFTCEHGTRYYPFGKGGREKLLKGLVAVDGEPTQQQKDAQWRLQQCPLHSLPLVADPEDKVDINVSISTPSTQTRPSPVCLDASCGHDHDHSKSSHESLGDSSNPALPVVLKEPSGDSARTFSQLSDDVINEVFRSQVEAITVSRC